MTRREEMSDLIDRINRKRLQIGECLFSSQRHLHRVSNARKLVSLATELAELSALLENTIDSIYKE